MTPNRNTFVRVVEAEGWLIGYIPGQGLMAEFKPAGMGPLVMEHYCSICAANGREDGQGDCEHKRLLRRHQPGRTVELSPAELDDEDAWQDYQDYQAEKRAAMRGVA